MPRTRLGGLLLALAVVVTTTGAGCEEERAPTSSTPDEQAAQQMSGAPTRPGVSAELRQSSLDVARGQMQVWVENRTGAPLLPTRLDYLDPRLVGALAGERLREVPDGARFGFVLPLPARPDCARQDRGRAAQRVEVRTADGTWRAEVEDETDVLGRHLAARCLELAVADVAELRWLPVRHDGGRGSTATMTLEVRPTGRPGHVLVLESVSGTPLLGAAGAAYWSPGVRVRSDGAPVRVPLEAQAARCDDHVFMEGGGSTAFRVGLRLDGEPGQLLVRMDERATASAVAFVRESCGL